ncbi:MAG TPA: cupredoxin domain-containing protein [Candidatus Limnocylindria bacterium]|nr:cupredoxin domain-containing protein [Candidatus Limnocylindria bacterium]
MRITAIAVVIIALASACSAPKTNPADGRMIEIVMDEFTFSPRTVALKAGETVTLKFTNKGSLEHEFMAGRSPVPSQGYTDDWLKRAVPALADHTHPGEAHVGEGYRVSADWGGRLKLVVPSEPGTYEFGCFIAGHYEAGMKGTITVR